MNEHKPAQQGRHHAVIETLIEMNSESHACGATSQFSVPIAQTRTRGKGTPVLEIY